jgi:hypothetical protein
MGYPCQLEPASGVEAVRINNRDAAGLDVHKKAVVADMIVRRRRVAGTRRGER